MKYLKAIANTKGLSLKYVLKKKENSKDTCWRNRKSTANHE